MTGTVIDETESQKILKIHTSGPRQTQAVGRVLGRHASAGDVFLLSGDLGTGKTCLTQGILWGLGGDEYARSPTFVLICEYPARLTLFHMDLYRLDSIDEIVDLGLDDYFLGDGVCVVEWAEKGTEAFIGEHLVIRIEDTGGENRIMTVEAPSQRYSYALEALRNEFTESEEIPVGDSAAGGTG